MIDEDVEQILKIRNLNELKRFNIRVVFHPQNVSSHSLFTAVFVNYLSNQINERFDLGFDTKSLVIAAMSHDFEESELGDVLIPTKHNYSSIKSSYDELDESVKKEIFSKLRINFYLAEPEKLLLKFCDRLEGYVYCLEEIELGNKHFDFIATNYLSELNSIADAYGDDKLYEFLMAVVEKIGFKVKTVRGV